MKSLFTCILALFLTACSQEPSMPDCFDKEQKSKILSIVTENFQEYSKDLGYMPSQVKVKPKIYRRLDVDNVSGTVYCVVNLETKVGDKFLGDLEVYYSIQSTDKAGKYYYRWVLQ